MHQTVKDVLICSALIFTIAVLWSCQVYADEPVVKTPVPVVVQAPEPEQTLNICVKLETLNCATDDFDRFPPQPRCCEYSKGDE